MSWDYGVQDIEANVLGDTVDAMSSVRAE